MSDEAAPQLDDRLVVDAGSPEGVARARKNRKREEDRGADFWRAVLSDPVGRAEVWQLLQEGGLFATPFAVGPNGFPQPEATWFTAGKKALVESLFLRLMGVDIDGVKLMLTDAGHPFFPKVK